MANKETISFYIQLHTYNGELTYSPLKTEAEIAKLKNGDTVALLLPFNYVDPQRVYREVITEEDTFNVVSSFLVAGEKVMLTYDRTPFLTYAQEKADKVQLTKDYLKSVTTRLTIG